MTGRAKATAIITQLKNQKLYTRRQYAQEIKWSFTHKKMKHKYLVKVRPFLGAQVSCMVDNVKPTLWDGKPDHITSHTGTYDLRSEKTSNRVSKFITELAIPLESDENCYDSL